MDTIVADNPKLILSAIRLNLRDGQPSQAVKLTFNAKILPEVIRLGNELMCVTPYTETVIRCTKCQRLGHKRSYCPSKTSICARCGQRAHDPDNEKNRTLCPATKDTSFCINCNASGHSAAWRGCPRLSLHQKASTESSRLGIPIGVVLQKLLKEGNHPPSQRDHSYYLNEALTQPSLSTSTLRPTPNPSQNNRQRSFAAVLQGRENKRQLQLKEKLQYQEQLERQSPSSILPMTTEIDKETNSGCCKRGQFPALAADPTASLSVFHTDTLPHAILPETAQLQTPAIMTQMKSRMENIINDKLTEISKSEALASSVAERLREKRKQQIAQLNKRKEEMTSKHPVTRLLGQCLVELVNAVELNQPQALLQTLTNIYNAGHKEAPVLPPSWNKELGDLAGLALGTTDVA